MTIQDKRRRKAEYMRGYRLTHLPSEKARRARRWQNERVTESSRQAKRYWLGRAFSDAALAGGCVDCGTKEQVVLEFDHVRGTKVASISTMLGGRRPLRLLFDELDKCDVRCANCHARVTAQRRKATAKWQ